MKKLIIGVMLTIAVLCLAACGGSSVKVGSFSSRYFNGDDYDNAVQEVFTYFSDWEGCTMTEIGYAGDDAVKAEAEIRGLAPEQVMVLTSTFTTDGEDHQNGLEPNYTYEDYKWIQETLRRSHGTMKIMVTAKPVKSAERITKWDFLTI